jgi:HPt (histidine-containing phosphotransfer) domain-containing protein
MSATMIEVDPVLDLNQLRERSLNDDEITRAVVNIFLRECPGWLDALRRGLRERNLKQLRLLGHLISGTAGTCGAGRLAAAARSLEKASRLEQTSKALDAGQRVLAAAEELEPRMRELL